MDTNNEKILMNFKKPNLFIIGAPKCGTTSLANYLNQHPDVGMCKYKEPFYFTDEFEELHKVSNLEEYLNLYNDETLENDIVFEGTTHYLMSSNAVDNILQFNPDAKFICMVRNPYDMIPSWHDELVYQGHQNLDFEDALEKAEKMNKTIGQKCYTDKNMMYDYLQVASNGRHIERLLYKVEPEQVKCVVFDEFISNTKKTFSSVCEFLNLAKTNIDFKKVNARKYHKFPKVVKLGRKIGDMLSLIGIKNTGLGLKLIDKQLDKTKKKRIINYSKYSIHLLDKDIRLLQQYIKMDLTNWIKTYG